MSTEPLLVTKRDDGVAIISTNDDPLNRMSVATLFGYCIGGGLELPLGCTFRLATSEGASRSASAATTRST